MLKVTTIVMAILIGGPVGWWATANLRGRAVAYVDLARGHYEVQGYGYPDPWRREYKLHLRERYGIEYRQVAFCTVSLWQRNYSDGYDSVMATAAQRKFGRDVVNQTLNEAYENWKMQHPVPQ